MGKDQNKTTSECFDTTFEDLTFQLSKNYQLIQHIFSFDTARESGVANDGSSI